MSLLQPWSFLILCCLYVGLNAQTDTHAQVPRILEDQIESFLQNLDDEIDFDFNTIGEYLWEFYENPLNLNETDREELERLQLLSDIQVADLIAYRQNLGPLLSIYELQAIPSFDRQTIHRIRPFITLKSGTTSLSHPRAKIRDGNNTIHLRWTRILQKQRGFLPLDDDPPAFEGDQNAFYLRYRHRLRNQLSYGMTLEKDPGEALFRGSNSHGFDFYSAHFYLYDLNSTVKSLAIGDYAVSLGQGLLMHSGFGRGKSAFVTQIKRGGRTIRPYTSVNEGSFLRGAATTLQVNNWQFTAFGSIQRVDGNIRIDSLENDEIFSRFSSLQFSGSHRTISEIEDENAVRHRVLGARVSYRKDERLSVSLNALNNHFNQPFQRRSELYNQFYFNGSELSNMSLDYTFLLQNFHFFGETAISDNGAMATTHGVLVGLSQYLDLAIHYRNFSTQYQALQANAFQESSQAVNENGLYIGLDLKFSQAFWLSLYADHWRHPWLRFNIDAPSTGKEYLARFTYYKKRKIDAYVQYRFEQKGFNDRINSRPLAMIFYGDRQNLRIHFNHQLNTNLELRNRIEFSWVNSPSSSPARGFLIFQDLIFRSLSSPLSFTTRLAYFDSDNYASRIYAYENDILYSFSVPAFFNEGLRYYLNLRYRLNKVITFEARWEETRFLDIDQISSGNVQIKGNRRSRIKLQCQIKF